MVTQGTLKRKRKKEIMRKRCIVALGVIVTAAVAIALTVTLDKEDVQNYLLSIYADKFAIEESTESEPLPVSAGVAETLNSCLTDDYSATIQTKSRELVQAAAYVSAEDNFIEIVENFKDYCLSNSQVSIDYNHYVIIGGNQVDLAEVHSQTDNTTLESHIVITKPDYALDMWYNQSSKDYFVNLSANDQQSNWVYIDNSAEESLYNFINNQVVYQSTYNTLSTVLSEIITNGNYEVIPGVNEDSYAITYTSDSLTDWSMQPTFYHNNLESWNITIQQISTRFFVNITFNYTDASSVSTELMSYSFEPTNSCNISLPLEVTEQCGTLSNLEIIYNYVKE